MNPIFIISNPRSGSSLLRILLNHHDSVVIPPECGFVQWLYPSYKDFQISDLKEFIKDLSNCKKIETWSLDYDKLYEYIIDKNPSSYSELCRLVYLFYGKSQNKSIQFWGDKNNYYIDHLETLLEIYPQAKFLYLERNPKDVCASYLNLKKLPDDLKYKPNLSDNVDSIYNEILENKTSIESFLLKIEDKNKINVKYENLIDRPTETLSKICFWARIPNASNILTNFDNKKYFDEPSETLAWKEKTLGVVDSANREKYKESDYYLEIESKYNVYFDKEYTTTNLLPKIRVENTDLWVYLPSIEYYIDRIRNNDYFHFIRVNHGILDNFGFTYGDDMSSLSESLKNKDYEKISHEIVNYVKSKGWYKSGENIAHYFERSKSTQEKLKHFVEVFTEYKNITPKLEIGVSMGVGLGDCFGTYLPNDPIQLRRKTALYTLMKHSPYEFFHSGISKHYSLMGEYQKMFDVLAELNFHVIFMGHDLVGMVKDVYDIKNYHYIEIPNVDAADNFDDYISQIKNIKSENENVMLFYSSGHILSAYLAYQLKDESMFAFDIGKSFEYDIKKLLPKDRWQPYDDWAWPNNNDAPVDMYLQYIYNIRYFSK